MQIPKERNPVVACHRQVQTTADLLMQAPRVAKLKRSLKLAENKNVSLRQKIKKLQNVGRRDNFLEVFTFADYKRLTYKFCTTKELADSIIDQISKAQCNSKKKLDIVI